MRTLNNRQERFIHEYLKDQNATAAAMRAGYSGKTKGVQAMRLMRDPLIAERIDLALGDLYARLDITAQSLLERRAQVAFFDPRRMFGADREARPLEEMDDDVASVLTVHLDEKPNGRFLRRIRQPSRHQAMAALERRYAQFLGFQVRRMELRQRMEAEWEEERAAMHEGVREGGHPAARTPVRNVPVLDGERLEDEREAAAQRGAVAREAEEVEEANEVEAAPALSPEQQAAEAKAACAREAKAGRSRELGCKVHEHARAAAEKRPPSEAAYKRALAQSEALANAQTNTQISAQTNAQTNPQVNAQANGAASAQANAAAVPAEAPKVSRFPSLLPPGVQPGFNPWRQERDQYAQTNSDNPFAGPGEE